MGQVIDSRLEDGDAFEKQAKELTKIYDAELGLDAGQYLQFQKKVEAFLYKAQIVREEFEGKEKLEKLYLLQTEEMAEMDDILTRIQWQRYVKIRPEIQPLEQLKEDN